jgi:hypothetical protein
MSDVPLLERKCFCNGDKYWTSVCLECSKKLMNKIDNKISEYKRNKKYELYSKTIDIRNDVIDALRKFKERINKELDICPNQIFSIMDEVFGVTKDE